MSDHVYALDVPLPEFLANKGITHVSDNVPNSHRVLAPAHALMALFEAEILAATTRQADPVPVPPTIPDPDADAFEEALAILGRLAAVGAR